MKVNLFRLKAAAAAILLCTALLCGSAVFAADENKIYTDITYCTANVYVCDSAERTIILKGIEMRQTDEFSKQAQEAAEYTEIPITHRALFNKDGQKIELHNINEEFLDRRAQVIIGKNGYGYKVIWFKAY